MRKMVAAALAALILAGCGAGTRIIWDRVRALEVGATADEVRDSLGDPYSITARGGQEIWIWSHVSGMSGQRNSLSLVMQDGKLITKPQVPDSF